jgi:hypothetical protein
MEREKVFFLGSGGRGKAGMRGGSRGPKVIIEHLLDKEET